MKVRYTETASVELEEILSYIAERNRSAGAALVVRIEKTISIPHDVCRGGKT